MNKRIFKGMLKIKEPTIYKETAKWDLVAHKADAHTRKAGGLGAHWGGVAPLAKL